MGGDLIRRDAAIAIANARIGFDARAAGAGDAGEGYDQACEDIAAALADMPTADLTVRQAAITLLNAHLDMPIPAMMAAVRAYIDVTGSARPVVLIRAWRDALFALAYPDGKGE